MDSTPSTSRLTVPVRPSAKEIRDFHSNADTDGSAKALHHTLGPGPSQAAPGNHSHDAGASSALTGYATSTHTHGAPQALIRSKISATADLSCASGAVVPLVFAASNYDTDSMADLANSRLVVKTAGWYRIYTRVVWASNAVNYRAALIYVNGNVVADFYAQAVTGSVTIITFNSDPIQLAINDNIAVRAVQGSGGALIVGVANTRYSYLAAEMASFT